MKAVKRSSPLSSENHCDRNKTHDKKNKQEMMKFDF